MTPLPEESGPGESIRHGLARNAVDEEQSAMELDHLVHDVSIEGPASYVVMLRSRIELLEKVLKSHGIDADASVAQLIAEEESSNQPIYPSCVAGSSNVDDICVTFDGALTLDESLNFDQDGEVRYFGPTSGRLLFRSSANASPTEEAYQTDASCNGCAPGDPSLSMSRVYKTSTDDHVDMLGDSSISDELEAYLIDLYFEWEQPWLQVVNETLFRESLACGGRYCSPLLLNCILALGSRYCDRLEVRADPNDSNTAGKYFIAKAEKLIQHDLRWPKITTIQSLAIMGMVYIAMGSDASGWLHQGMANRLALDMGLNMDPAVLAEKVALSPIEIELRRQIYWALYCNDKLSASYTGRVCTLLDSQGAVNMPYLQCTSEIRLPSANGGLRAASQKEVTGLHRSMISLCRILEKILLSLWSPKPLIHAHQRSAFFDSCILELKTWAYDLPSELKMDRPKGPSRFPHVYTMSMVYHTAYLLLCEPFMKEHYSSDDASNTTSPVESKVGKNSCESLRLEKAISSCCASVRSMVIIAQKYRQMFGSFKLSPITATHCILSAGLIIVEKCCSLDYSQLKQSSGDDVPRMLPPHAAAGLCFQVLRELSTSWNIAKRIGCNLEKVYIQRYGVDHLPPLVQVGDPITEPRSVGPDGPWEPGIPPLHAFEGVFDVQNGKFEDPLSLHLENPFAHPHNPNMNQLHDQPFDGTQQSLPTLDELFAHNLGVAFTPDCLPSDYNMFDTLNQMYLEETW
ncbi:uncharacterized protein N7443_003335 [Penicillium atrosanguineum]|uniref:uncharacterized protein n=1 Tax=Penicillium atrosanguineum TaxID=1132637 RepID=UPI0023863606|nr:uncharacterized protein N7443_003335 [Penicillium atrosanguineum]KAJ5310874.1 hypothetical protein N7443_003335 [Penicillium atrosanguineum]